jgi:uncharacterized membrane protein
MKKFVRCKACGYITTENKIKDVCPACGVQRKAFEEYKNPLSTNRARLLDLHIHPIIVHFPQAFAVMIPFLLLISLLPLPFENEVLSAALVFLYLMPLAAIAAILTGLIDGKTRFKTIKTQILKRKIVLGALLLLLSVINAIIVNTTGTEESIIPLLIISIVCVICEVFLGNLGSSLMESRLPG